MLLDISNDLSLSNIKDGFLVHKIPELYELKNCIENNPWHHNISVFDHTVEVLEQLDKILLWLNQKLLSHLDIKVERNKKKDLLYLASLFHDISKNDTFDYKEWFWTVCPGHEELWAIKVKPILNKIDLTLKEKSLVEELIKYHWEIHYLLKPDFNVKEYKEKHKGRFIELILLAYVDTLASELKIDNKKDYDFRIEFYKNIILNF